MSVSNSPLFPALSLMSVLVAGSALYFSRAPIPFAREDYTEGQPAELPFGLAVRRHLGIYAYRVSLLRAFVSWEVETLESIEKLEQLRALVHGVRIHVADAPCVIPPGVDTAEDLERARAALAAHSAV